MRLKSNNGFEMIVMEPSKNKLVFEITKSWFEMNENCPALVISSTKDQIILFPLCYSDDEGKTNELSLARSILNAFNCDWYVFSSYSEISGEKYVINLYCDQIKTDIEIFKVVNGHLEKINMKWKKAEGSISMLLEPLNLALQEKLVIRRFYFAYMESFGIEKSHLS